MALTSQGDTDDRGTDSMMDLSSDPRLSTVVTKRALLVASRALERAFADVEPSGPSSTVERPPQRCDIGDEGLLIGFFQRREYFDVEASRYAALAAQGHCVIVAFTGPTAGVPDGVTALSLADGDPRGEDWVLTMVRGAFAATLCARDVRRLSTVEASMQASRLFASWTTLRRDSALGVANDYLDDLALQLPTEVLARARRTVQSSVARPVNSAENRLADAADHLMRSVDAGYQRAVALRLELESTKSLAERDQLTGLHNRHYLVRYLGDGEQPADLLALLVDVDGLKQVNDVHGHEAGDALLRYVANSLRSHSRPGDVLVRWGGDEFLLLLPHLDASAGLRQAERLATAISTGRVDPPWDELAPSVSIGVSLARHTPLPMAQLDVALYQAKRHNRGHAAMSDGGPSPLDPLRLVP